MMTFPTAVQTCFRKYVTFAGRAGRAEYWWFVLFMIGAAIILYAVDRAIFGPRDPMSMWPQPLSGLFQLAMLLPAIAVGFRRLQDTGKPGWLILIPVGISVFANVVLAATPSIGLTAIMGLIQLIILVVMIWLLTRPSQPGDNAHGPNPHGQ